MAHMHIQDDHAIKAGDNGEDNSDSTSSGEKNDTTRALFERLIKDLMSSELLSLEEVLKHHQKELKKTTEEGDTILHLIAAAGGPCIKIGAAEASGEAYEWVGASPVDFLFPSHNVLRSRPGGGLDNNSGGRLTGSSVATVLPAGLAALALYCVHFAVQYAVVANVQGQHVAAEDLCNLRTRHGMEAAFHAIGTTAASQHKYLEVWDVFGPAAKLGAGHLEREKREAIVMVAKRLITTKKMDVLRRWARGKSWLSSAGVFKLA